MVNTKNIMALKDMHVKIKAKNPKAVAGIRLIVPFDGLIAIDANGEVEVTDECAKALVTGTNDWLYAEEKAEAAVEEETVAEEEEEEHETEAEPTDREKFAAELETMTVAQMKDLCRDGGFPEEEWKSLKKATLAAYLLDKFDYASGTADEEPEEEEEEEEEL